VTTLIGLAADAGSVWADLRVGELKALLGLAVGDVDVILEGCDWISQFGELPEKRARVYRCIADLVQLQEMAELDHTQPFNANLALMYGVETLQQAQQLLSRQSRYFCLPRARACRRLFIPFLHYPYPAYAISYQYSALL
jgi:ribosomal protein S12 methylthiotransferase accessory factor